MPTPPEELALLLGVSGTSSDDVWAVGQHQFWPAEPIILHWDGAKWTKVPFQKVQGRYLFGVAAISRIDAWAVGYSVTDQGTHSLAMHWDGRRWRMVRTPTGVPQDQLNGVSAISSDDVWAVGSFTDDSGNIRPLTIHWDGMKWRIVPLPDPSPLADLFSGVAAVTTDDVWAVGYQSGLLTPTQPLIGHWSGSGWSIFPQPDFPNDRSLAAVSASSAADVWAVGNLIEHWDGATWKPVSAPILGTPRLRVGLVTPR